MPQKHPEIPEKNTKGQTDTEAGQKLKGWTESWPLKPKLPYSWRNRDTPVPRGGNEEQGAKTTLFNQFSTKERRIGIKLARGDKRREILIYPPATGAEAASELI